MSISISEGKLIVAPQRKSYTLEELLEKVTPENLHTEVDTGSCLGSES